MRRLWLACVAAGVNGMTSAPTVSSAPALACTCDKELEVKVRTDSYPSETSWTVTGEDCSRSGVLAERNDYADQETTYVDKITLCEGGTYTFEIFDSASDGICCGYGAGWYSLKLDGVEIQRGGDFGSGDVYEFFGTTLAPTTLAPTSTPAPTASPLVADNESIREAVKLWLSDRAAAIRAYGHISTWETGGVTDMDSLFDFNDNSGAASFNEDIGAWDTSGVTTMRSMFNRASAFNQDIGDWSVDGVTDMRGMFYYASAFNRDIGGWAVHNVMSMDYMFYEASAFDQALGWCVREEEIINNVLLGTKCAELSCGVVQGICPDPDVAAGEYCKLSDRKLCSGGRTSFVEAPSNPFADIGNRYAVPALADVDGDGNDDLLVGQEDGTLAFYRHAESAFQHVIGDEDPFKSVAVVGRAAPALVDLDGDGNLDLIVGAAGGELVYYRNEGSGYERVTGTPAPTTAPDEHGLRLVGGSSTFEGRVEIFHEGQWGTVCDNEWDINDANVVCEQLFGVDALKELKESEHSFGPGSGPIWMDDVECVGDEAALWQCNFRGWGIHSSCDHNEDAGVVCEAAPTASPTSAPTAEDINDRDPFVGIAVDAHSAPAFADIDGDGLADLVIGKETSGQGALTYYKNVGSRTAATFRAVPDGPFATVGVGSFSKPTFYDLDNDGDEDLIVGDDVGDVLLFLNVGSRFAAEFTTVGIPFAGIFRGYATPVFGVLNGVPSLVVGSAPGPLVVYGETPKVEFMATKFSPFSGIDVTVNNAPAFVDLDNDGDLDLVVGGWYGTLSYWRNVGTASQPRFEKVEALSPFDGIDVGQNSAPTMADVDGDGDLDLVVGEQDGALHYYRNVGTPSQPNFTRVDEESPFEGIDVNGDNVYGYSAPTLADLDNDGLLDLVVGEDDGGLNYYRNVGNSSQPNFTKVDEYSPFDGIDVLPRSNPAFVDLDSDGLMDIVVGEWDGVLNYYRNVGTPQQPTFEKVEEDSPFDGIDVGFRSAPTFVDLDDDGDLDLLVGNSFGKISYFENVNSCRKSLEGGSCSRNGICGAFRDGVASCECVSTFIGAQCDACAAGAGGQDCSLCAAGKFSTAFSADCETCAPGKTSNAGASFCFDCAAGTSRSEGQADCTTCAEGTFAGAGQESCENCDFGRFARDTGSSVCDLAAPGYFVAFEGATRQTPCSFGEFSGSAASTCGLCSPGTWSGEGEAQCTSCAAGTFSGAGSATCSTCEPGQTSNAGASSCFDCPAGKSRAEGEANCSPCGPGTYSEARATTCENCERGRFARGQENPACELAGAGYFVATSGASEQRKCAKGSFSSGSASFECTSCDAGKYADEEGLDACKPADRGYYVKDTGATKQEKCPAGTYSSGEGATSCVPANSGFFVEDEGATGQDECPAGKFSSEPRATSCDECPEGEFNDKKGQSSCTPAHEGHYVDKKGATKEEECSTGEYASGAGNDACKDCDAGKFAKKKGMGDCDPAGEGHYVPDSGADEQKECDRGTYASGRGATSCVPANSGFFVPGKGATGQDKCPAGKFSRNSKASSCDDCPQGEFNDEEGQSSCTPADPGYATTFSRRLAGARSLASSEGATGQAPCPRGTFSISGSSECTPCTVGKFAASERSTECVSAEPGYFVASYGAFEQVSCPRGKHASGASNSECSSCETGKFAGETGRADCALAEAGYYVAEAGVAEQIQCAAGTYASGQGSSTCTTANAGSFVKDQGADKEEKCAKGTFSSAPGSKVCTDCPKGEFSNEVGRSSCTPASEGRFVDTTRATEEEVCPTGKHASGSGNEACKDCEPGKFAAEIGMGDCVSADAGNHVEGSGADEQRACEPGTYAPGDGASACTDASSGFFVAEAGAIEQTACPAGSFSSGSGSAECEPCPKGEFNSEPGKAGCTPASSGHFVASEGASQEERCPKGRHASGGGSSACAPCEPGKYADEEGLGECKAAGSGHFVSTQGATEQTPCSAGTYMADDGASKCTSANAGFFVEEEGATVQLPCSAGSFTTSPASSTCSECPAGTFSSEGEASCTPCAAGFTSSAGAARCTQCEAGSAKPAGAGACVPCEKGSYAEAGSEACKAADPGYHVEKPLAARQEPCPAGRHASGSGNEACTLCEPGKYADEEGLGECKAAGPGHFVLTQGATRQTPCSAGTYMADEGASKCTSANAGFFVEGQGATAQSPCLAGTFSAGSGGSACENCAAGTFSSEREASCTPCPAGASSPSGAERCTQCEAGSAKPAGEGACVLCEAGTYAGAGSDVCKAASPGHYVDKPGAPKQKPCPRGTFASGSGNIECSDCSPGSYSDTDAASVCTRAKRGHFVAEPRAMSPKKCEIGRYAPGEGSSSCTDANAGFYVDGDAAEEQTPCRPGFFSTTAASTCELCAAGEFSADEGKASCTSCPAGASSEAGSTHCSECERGKAKPAGHGECVSCEPGRFADAKGAGECKLADAGSYVEELGAFGQNSCLPGTYSPGAGAVECTQCEEGRYVARERATACDLASGGEYVATTGATKPSKCIAGRFSGSGASSCEPCEPGTVSEAGASACTLADAGEYTNRHPTYVLTLESELTMEGYLDSDDARNALWGMLNEAIEDLGVVTSIRPAVVTERLSNASPTEGFSTSLLFTIEANYTAVPGEDMRNVSALMLDDFKSRFEQLIEEGTLQERLDDSDILALAVVDVDASLDGVRRSAVTVVRIGPPGVSNGLTSDCPAGKSSQSGAFECTDCLKGGTEVSCSNNSALQNQCAHAEDPNDCLFSQCCKSCADLGSGVGTCNAPTGTTLETLPVERGFWRATGLEETIYRCFYERACVGSQKDEESYGDGLCREGSKGPLCTVCEHDHYFSMTRLQCEKCGSVSVLILVIVVLVAAALLAALLYASLNPGSWEACGLCMSGDWGDAAECVAGHVAERQSSSASEKRKTSEGDGKPEPPRPDESTSEKKRSSSAFTKLKIVISCYQIVAGAHVLLPSIPWPLAYEQLVRIFGFASLDLSGVARTACVFPWMDYIWSMEISTVWPIVLLLLTYLACRCAKKVDEWTYFAFLLIFLVFPSNSASVLRFFNCVKFDARGRSPRTIKVLMADMSIGCRSDRYKLTRIFAWVMLVIYPVGVPVLCIAVLFWYRKRINPKSDVAPGEDTPNDRPGVTRTASIRKLLADTNKVERAPLRALTVRDNDEGLDRFRFLFEDYEPRCWWFAVVELIRRLYLTGLLAFFGSDEEPTSMTQTSMGLLGAIIYFIVLAHFNPYYDSADELLSKVAAVQVILTFFGATVLQAKDNSKDSEAGDPNGVYAGPVFAGVCVSVGLVTLVFALYLFLSEMKTYATRTRVGRQLSSSVDAVANYAKRIRRIGSSEIGAEEEAKDDAAAAAL